MSGSFTSALQIASGITGVFGFVSFVATLYFYFKRAELRNREVMLAQAPPKERAKLLDTWLTRYSLDAKELSHEMRFQLIMREMNERHRLHRISQRNSLILALSLLVATVILVIAAILRPADQGLPHSNDKPWPKSKMQESTTNNWLESGAGNLQGPTDIQARLPGQSVMPTSDTPDSVPTDAGSPDGVSRLRDSIANEPPPGVHRPPVTPVQSRPYRDVDSKLARIQSEKKRECTLDVKLTPGAVQSCVRKYEQRENTLLKAERKAPQ